jgi:hypothetical protein
MPHASSDHSASIHNGIVYIVGAGDDGNEVLRYDPASAEWSTLAPSLNDRVGLKLIVLGGILHTVGGGRVERYDVASDTWTWVVGMPQERSYCEAVTIASAGPVEDQDFFDSLIEKASRRQP